MKRKIILTALAIVSVPVFAQDVHMANGIKIGEVDSTSAIVWTRLTKHPERNVDGKPFPKNENKKRRSLAFENLDEMEGSVTGITGEVRVIHWKKGDAKTTVATEWSKVDAATNYARQFQLKGLEPASAYSIRVDGRKEGADTVDCRLESELRTAPAVGAEADVRFTVVTGQDYPRRDDKKNGHKVYPAMQKLKPDFFVHTGDIEYYDKPAPYADNVELARFKWNRIYALPFQRDFHNAVASYFIKDDHDTLKNDCWPGQNYGDLTWEQGLKLFPEQVPMGEKTYRTIRWGKDLQIWLMEGRDFRSPNNMPDGPEKSIWGKEQKQWFYDTVEKSDATFRVLISPTPVVGPDRGGKNDNHANKGFTHEGEEIRAFIGKQKNMFIVCGDRHWQYVSLDPVSGVREFSCGPTTDEHAGGFSEANRSDMHQYLKVKGGFLSVEVSRNRGQPGIVFRHHGVEGKIYNEDSPSFRH